jgi:ferric-dicitrate binding protein FerR (iron transport regulator)
MEDNKDDIIRKIRILKALDTDIRENKRIDISRGYEMTFRKIRKRFRKQWIHHVLNKAAAILVIPLIISTSVLFYMQVGEHDDLVSSQSFIEISAVPGAIVKTKLPDDSEVWLNSGSSLRYPTQFTSEKREVELSGEAFFEVKTNPEQPFEVSTSFGMKVIARGTAFNVNAYEDEATLETVLQRGRVDMVWKMEETTLSPGEIALYERSTGQLSKSVVNIDEKIAWKEGLLIFRKTSLDDVFKKLSRRYNVNIILHKETKIDYRIRATFSTETLEQILNVLKMAAPITWSVKKMEQNSDFTYPQQCIEVWVK